MTFIECISTWLQRIHNANHACQSLKVASTLLELLFSKNKEILQENVVKIQ